MEVQFYYIASKIFWLLITFGGLYLLMSRVALPRLARIMDQRQQRIDTDLQAVREAKEEAEQIQTAYEANLAEAQDKAHEEAQKTANEIKGEDQRRSDELEARLSEKLSQGEQRVRDLQKEAQKSVREITEDLTSSLVVKLGGEQAEPSVLEAAVRRVTE